MTPDIGLPPLPGQKRPRSRQSTSELTRSRSNTSSKSARHSRSRGSTASIQSATTQFLPELQRPHESFPPYPTRTHDASQAPYDSNPEEMILRYGEQFVHSQPARLSDPALQEHHNSVRPRSDIPDHTLHNRNIVPHHPHQVPQPHHISAELQAAHFPHIFDGPENNTPEPILDPSKGSDTGPRKRRGTTASIANDNELRRLLHQYDGYTLLQMAAEVRKHEGEGGKSEKVKQVFAMIWLRENCHKGNGSVRRDRVYCCYAERCGNDRVSVLNPASFGKLVRIIFPNVQTRRLGVRGESKYHYVDLSLIGPECKPEYEQAEQMDKNPVIPPELDLNNALHRRSPSVPHNQQPKQSIDNSISSAPLLATNFLQKSFSSSLTCSCSAADKDLRESELGVDPLAFRTQVNTQNILRLEPIDLPTTPDNDVLSLPTIHEYLPENADSSAADALAALYRSHCTSVIDSFRYCKEKNLFRHFSAFQGTLTVPVHKLFVHPNIAPWIEECDWLMYQKMLAFIAPLTNQVVPEPVLKAFQSISYNLVPHIANTFKSQPEHMSRSRVMPCQLFCHLLKRVLDVNQAANAAAAWLCHAQNRNKMWEEFTSFVDPIEVVLRANIPACSVKTTIAMLQEHVKTLLYPLDNCTPPQLDSFDQNTSFNKFSFSDTGTEEYNGFPDRWILFIEQLPSMFPHHSAKCILDKTDAIWTAILHRLTLAGAESFSAWWMTKVFFLEMIHWQAERCGFMTSSPKSLRQQQLNDSKGSPNMVAETESSPLQTELPASTQSTQTSDADVANISIDVGKHEIQNGCVMKGSPKPNNPDDDSTNLRSVESSPTNRRAGNNDDSAIALDDDSVLLSTNKYADMTASDPADAEGEVIVV
ncbi:hypothetical protein FQN57_004098 [Myotisia sp. PD_48]|nr:hypothetical protein FQN57_004098 [Myotisia sp. PD_48]